MSNSHSHLALSNQPLTMAVKMVMPPICFVTLIAQLNFSGYMYNSEVS
jgi:hypothetical protein